MQELTLGKIPIHRNSSGYIYLNVPKHLCETFHIGLEGHFVVVYRDGRLILSYERAEPCSPGSS